MKHVGPEDDDVGPEDDDGAAAAGMFCSKTLALALA